MNHFCSPLDVDSLKSSNATFTTHKNNNNNTNNTNNNRGPKHDGQTTGCEDSDHSSSDRDDQYLGLPSKLSPCKTNESVSDEDLSNNNGRMSQGNNK